MKPITRQADRALDHHFEALMHQLLELHPLLDH
jgi:hypothetical protein